MTEHGFFREPSGPERLYTEEQLLNGLILGPREFLRFRPHDVPTECPRAHSIGPRTRLIKACAVGEFSIGTQSEHTVGLITVEFEGGKPFPGVTVIFNPLGVEKPGGRRRGLRLGIGSSIALGRAAQPELFPRTVDDLHCWVGMDEVGQFVLENGLRPDATFVRRC